MRRFFLGEGCAVVRGLPSGAPARQPSALCGDFAAPLVISRVARRVPRCPEKSRTRREFVEEDVPAEQAQAPEEARISQAHVDACRARSSEAPPCQGTRPHLGVVSTPVDRAERTPTTSRGRITRSGDFDAVYRRGKSAAGRHLVVYMFRRDALDGPARVGMSISKRVGGAVERNRLKRVLRERFAEFSANLAAGTDFVVIARPGAVEYLDEMGSEAVAERLRELVERVSGETLPVAS